MNIEETKIADLKEIDDQLSSDVPEFPDYLLALENPLEIFHSEAVKASHPAEPDLFVRHDGVPAHNQASLGNSRVVGIGAGGLGSSAFVCLARSGARHLTIIDDDRVDRTNLSRQFFFAADLGQPKGICLARNMVSHAVDGATITGIGLCFADALEKYPLPADLFVVGVDNNECRLQAVREARRRHIPAVFTMLSTDGMRCQVFSQGPSPLDPCLWCALPNLDPEKIMPCASAIISSCFLASAFTVFFAHRALMGWGPIKPFNWREADLSGASPDKTGNVTRRTDCWVCSGI